MRPGAATFSTETTQYSSAGSYYVQQARDAPQIVNGDLTVNGTVRTTAGELTVANDNGAASISLTGLLQEPRLLPPAYSFVMTPSYELLLSRVEIPYAEKSDALILTSTPTLAGSASDVDNTIALNGLLTVNGPIFTLNGISGFNSIRYETDIYLGNKSDPIETIPYNGITMYVEPYGTGEGHLNIQLPDDFLTDEIYTGVTVFMFVCDSTDEQTIHILDHTGATVKTIITNQDEIATVYSLSSGLAVVTTPLTNITKTPLAGINRVSKK
jgi:hypothetical protein